MSELTAWMTSIAASGRASHNATALSAVRRTHPAPPISTKPTESQKFHAAYPEVIGENCLAS